MVPWSLVLAAAWMGCTSPDTCALELVRNVLRCLYPGCL